MMAANDFTAIIYLWSNSLAQNQPAQYAACPNCGQTNATKMKFTWWGGALGPAMFTHVKCNNCKTEYNGKSGRSNQTNIIIYFRQASCLFFVSAAEWLPSLFL